MVKNSSEILTGIKEENSHVLYFVYQNFYPQVETFILIAHGSTFDAQDVFQDAMVVIYNKVKRTNFELKYSFGTYLFSVSKYIWFKELKRRQKENSYLEAMNDDQSIDSDIEEAYIKMEKRKLILDHFMTLSPQYQRLLTLFFEKTPISEITKIMNYSSDQYTKNRRNYCKGLLVNEIRKNPRFNELRNESFKENSSIPRW
ncbi:MAG: sigma-70 family RNA polymerase sigma factor [Bacteroidales bacterium]|nr:sigma-70 family RNA polymerase sigma factor [Bacteroidales bacterium]